MSENTERKEYESVIYFSAQGKKPKEGATYDTKAYELGEVIEGTFLGKSEKPGRNGSTMTTFYIENGNSLLGLNGAGDLVDRMADSGVQKGTHVKVELSGIRETNSGNEFRLFNVING